MPTYIPPHSNSKCCGFFLKKKVEGVLLLTEKASLKYVGMVLFKINIDCNVKTINFENSSL